jgi:hypothetical protein
MSPIVTLTTDFGWSTYVAQMKGVLLSRVPSLSIVDITHDIPPQDTVTGAIALADACTWFPQDTIHIAVVDPGVGTDRSLVYTEHDVGRFLAPDNGLLGLILQRHALKRAYGLSNPRHWSERVAPTFHGRDILARVAVALLSGVHPEDLGPAIPANHLRGWPVEGVTWKDEHGVGCIVAFDPFGNAITNITGRMLGADLDQHLREEIQVVVQIEGIAAQPRWVRHYGQASGGSLVALLGSSDHLEIAKVGGSARTDLGLRQGQCIRVRLL